VRGSKGVLVGIDRTEGGTCLFILRMAGLCSFSCVGILGSKHITPKWIYMLQALCAPFGIVLLDMPISEPDVKVLAVGVLRGSGHISFLTCVSRALKVAYNCNVCCYHNNKYNRHLTC
jgi:ABC-type transport system involved in cytochrome c biogenesis permease component